MAKGVIPTPEEARRIVDAVHHYERHGARRKARRAPRRRRLSNRSVSQGPTDFPDGVSCRKSHCRPGSEILDNTICCESHAIWNVETPPFGLVTLEWVSADVWESFDGAAIVTCGANRDSYLFRYTQSTNADGHRSAVLELVAGEDTGNCDAICLKYVSCCTIQCLCDHEMVLEDFGGGDVFDVSDLSHKVCVKPQDASSATTEINDGAGCLCGNIGVVSVPTELPIKLSGGVGGGCNGSNRWWVNQEIGTPGGPTSFYPHWVNINFSAIATSNTAITAPAASARTNSAEDDCERWQATDVLVGRYHTVLDTNVNWEHDQKVYLFERLNGANCEYWFELHLTIPEVTSTSGTMNLYYESDVLSVASATVTASDFNDWIADERTWTFSSNLNPSCVEPGICGADEDCDTLVYPEVELPTTGTGGDALSPPIQSGDCADCGVEGYGGQGGGGGGGTGEVACCANQIPATLVVTITDPSGNCPCAPGAYNLSWTGSFWQGQVTLCTYSWVIWLICNESAGGTGWTMVLYCVTGSSTDGYNIESDVLEDSCDPFQVVFTSSDTTATACGCATSLEGLVFTVTE